MIINHNDSKNIAKGTTDPRLEFISQYYIYYKINSGPKGPTIAEFVKHPVTDKIGLFTNSKFKLL